MNATQTTTTRSNIWTVKAASHKAEALMVGTTEPTMEIILDGEIIGQYTSTYQVKYLMAGIRTILKWIEQADAYTLTFNADLWEVTEDAFLAYPEDAEIIFEALAVAP